MSNLSYRLEALIALKWYAQKCQQILGREREMKWKSNTLMHDAAEHYDCH